MSTRRTNLSTILGCMFFTLATLPALSFAQGQGGGGRPGGGGMTPPGGAASMLQARQILQQLDLSDDQNKKIQDIVHKLMQDMRDARSSMQDATQEERMQKMQELRKEGEDTKKQVLDILTPDQQAKFASKSAEATLKWAKDMLTAVQKASVKTEIGDDQRKQLATVFDDTSKTLDGYQPEVADVKDDDASTKFTQKVTKTMSDANDQLKDILGDDDARELVQSAQRTMPGGNRGGRGGGQNGRGAGRDGPNGGGAAPSTQPAPN